MVKKNWKGTKPDATDILSPAYEQDLTVEKYVITNNSGSTNNIEVRIIKDSEEGIVCKFALDDGDYAVEDEGLTLLQNEHIKIISDQVLSYVFSFKE